MNLSPHFTLDELTTTNTGLTNDPSEAHVEELQRLCVEVLEPWRLRIGRIQITSGYRSAAVNLAVDGSPSSDHRYGRAADCKPLDCSLEDAWSALRELVPELPIDQAIVYQRPAGKGWIHVGRRPAPRREVLVQLAGGRYVPWSGFRGLLVLG